MNVQCKKKQRKGCSYILQPHVVWRSKKRKSEREWDMFKTNKHLPIKPNNHNWYVFANCQKKIESYAVLRVYLKLYYLYLKLTKAVMKHSLQIYLEENHLDNYDIAGLVMEWLIVQQKHGHLIIFLRIFVWMSLPFMTYFKRPLIDFTGMWVVWKENTNPNIIKKNIRIDLFIRKSYSPKWGCSVIDNHAYLKVFLVIKHTEGCHYWSNERPTVVNVFFYQRGIL